MSKFNGASRELPEERFSSIAEGDIGGQPIGMWEGTSPSQGTGIMMVGGSSPEEGMSPFDTYGGPKPPTAADFFGGR